MVDFSTSHEKLLPVIGLTGGIGSGKSTVAGIFASLGVPIFNADERAKSLYSESADLRSWVVDSFGVECGQFENGTLVGINRAELAQQVFGHPDRLDALNERIHPEVARRFQHWLQLQSQMSGASYAVREAAILIESARHLDCAAIISVEAPEALRVTRAANRMDTDASHIRARIAAQLTDAERAKYASFRIFNDDSDELLHQVQRIHEAILLTAETQR